MQRTTIAKASVEAKRLSSIQVHIQHMYKEPECRQQTHKLWAPWLEVLSRMIGPEQLRILCVCTHATNDSLFDQKDLG